MKIIVRIAHPDGRAVESRVFHTSPVSIGRAAGNMLRLEHHCMRSRQGILVFTAETIEYVDYGSTVAPRIDGIPAQEGVPVRLQDLSLVEVGPFRSSVESVRNAALVPPGSATAGIGMVRAIATSGTLPDETDPLCGLLSRAVKLADAVSTTIIQLRHARPLKDIGVATSSFWT
jgi:hypothetical protein